MRVSDGMTGGEMNGVVRYAVGYARVVNVEEGASYATGGPVRKERIPRNANRQNALKWKHVDIPFQASNQSIMLVKQDIQ